MTNQLIDTFREIRNYLSLVEKNVFRFCDDEYEQFRVILDKFSWDFESDPHNIKQVYEIELVHEDNIGEREHGEDEYPDIPCFYIFKVKGKFYKLPGTYSSWESSSFDWESSHEVNEDYTPVK